MEAIILSVMIVVYMITMRSRLGDIKRLVIGSAVLVGLFGTMVATAADIEYNQEYKAITVVGVLESGDEEDLIFELAKHKDEVQWVTLHSEGGSVDAGLRMAQAIRNAKVNTYVPQYCASACTMAFMGGKERWINSDAEMAYHFAYVPEENAQENISKSEYYFYGQYGAYWVVQEYIKSVEPMKTKSALTYMLELLVGTSPDELKTADNDRLLKSGIATNIN